MAMNLLLIDSDWILRVDKKTNYILKRRRVFDDPLPLLDFGEPGLRLSIENERETVPPTMSPVVEMTGYSLRNKIGVRW